MRTAGSDPESTGQEGASEKKGHHEQEIREPPPATRAPGFGSDYLGAE